MAMDYVSKANPEGTSVGQSAADLINLYGGTPVAQRSSTVLATSLLSASSYVSIASNTALILTQISQVLTGIGACRVTA